MIQRLYFVLTQSVLIRGLMLGALLLPIATAAEVNVAPMLGVCTEFGLMPSIA